MLHNETFNTALKVMGAEKMLVIVRLEFLSIKNLQCEFEKICLQINVAMHLIINVYRLS